MLKYAAMSYLEQNAAMVRELGAEFPREQIGDTIGKGNTMAAYIAGSLATSAGAEVPIAVKLFSNDMVGYFEERNRVRFTRSLAFMTMFGEAKPELRSLLPSFYALLTDSEGVPVGQITEDFSCGGTHRVYDYSYLPFDRPQEINNIISSLIEYSDDLIKDDQPLPDDPPVRTDTDYMARALNEVEDVGPRFVDLFAEPIEPDPYARVSRLDPVVQQKLADRIGRILQVERVANELALHTVTLVD